ncbi:methyltransferase domain-containing protein [Aquibium sp. LZ166]|uniref:Methyltransferase domain-containing protein n=1 Tax=Aquibium pacificus TaxID=3153579 RepID=A0ABV3SGF7_9HYPH
MASGKPNSQYNVAKPDSLAIRLAHRQREVMFERWLRTCSVGPQDTILDVGVTSDTTYSSSNYLEAWYPQKSKIVACGIDDASFLEDMYPGMTFVKANGLDLPFEDGSFDVVHSSAVLEHVGSYENQMRFVRECARVCRRTFFLTTPNRWFPVEFHTSLPLVHWLPKSMFRGLLRRTSLGFFADEANLNLMTGRELAGIGKSLEGWSTTVETVSLGGLTSNIVLVGTRCT